MLARGRDSRDVIFGSRRGVTSIYIDPKSGEQLWTKDTGDRRYTAPVLGRDTLFVGGNKLFAFDPTPASNPFSGDGPALGFEESFHGRVGPVLDDGVENAVAQTGKPTYQLVALE